MPKSMYRDGDKAKKNGRKSAKKAGWKSARRK